MDGLEDHDQQSRQEERQQEARHDLVEHERHGDDDRHQQPERNDASHGGILCDGLLPTAPVSRIPDPRVLECRP